MYCIKCGALLPDDTKVCPACGERFEKKVDFSNLKDKAKEVLETEDASREFSRSDKCKSHRWLSVLAYLGPTVFIPMFVKKDSPFVQFHVREGVNLFFLDVCYLIIYSVENAIAVNMHRFIRFFLDLPVAALSLGILILTLIGAIRALQGKAKKLPIIGNLSILEWFTK